MKTYCTVDIESDYLTIDGRVTKIFVIGVKSGNLPVSKYTNLYHPLSSGNLKAALNFINTHDYIIGHNIVKFDIPKIEQLVGPITCTPIDTLLDAKLMFTTEELSDIDRGITNMPSDLRGSFSLAAFGFRIGDYKILHEDFSKLSTEMILYCEQDIELTYKLHKFLVDQHNYPPEKVRHLEYAVASIMHNQQQDGFYFDIDQAKQLDLSMKFRQMNIQHKLQSVFKPKYLADGPPKTPAGDRRVKEWTPNLNYNWKSKPPLRHIRNYTHYKNGRIKLPAKTKYKFFTEPHKLHYSYTLGEYQPIKLTKFNPGSRQHIERWLKDMYGWTPTEFTSKGTSKIDAETLKNLEYPEATLLKQYLKLVKDISQLSGTDNSLISCYYDKTHSIHGSVDTLGTVTRRATHYAPNLSQTPKKDPSKGQDGEFRKLFTVPEGWVFVGADASALTYQCTIN